MPPPGPVAPTRHPDPSIEHRVLISLIIGPMGGTGALAPATVMIEALATSAAIQTKLT